MVRRFRWPVVLVLLAVAACGCRSAAPRPDGSHPPLARPCPEEAPAPPALPFSHPLHSLLDFWLGRTASPRAVLLDAAAIERHNRRVQALHEHGWPVGQWDLDELRLDGARVRPRLRARLDQFREAMAKGQRVLLRGEPAQSMLTELEQRMAQVQLVDERRAVHRSQALRCFPTDEGVYEKAWQQPFDLNQCAQLRVGELVRVAGRIDGYLYVWSTYADGWVKPEALTPPLSSDDGRRLSHPDRFVVVQVDRLPLWADKDRNALLTQVRLGARLPLLEEEEGALRVMVPAPGGLRPAWVAQPDAVSVGYPPLTRAALLTRAFALLNAPYGWGGLGENRDCSRMMMDLFAAFGVRLPRNTWHQSQAGVRGVDVGRLPEEAKATAIEDAAKRGLVLLHMPGHIMLYLGRDGEHLYALHQFSGYLVPCAKGGETMVRVNRTVVTALDLGLGSTRRSFLQRISRLIIFEREGAP